jgi:hypothetical protein
MRCDAMQRLNKTAEPQQTTMYTEMQDSDSDGAGAGGSSP